MHRHKDRSVKIYFVGTCFENPTTGGMIYNANVANELSKKWNLQKVNYPWDGYFRGLIFDLKLCLQIFKSLIQGEKIVLIYDESLYQRMPFTLLFGASSGYVSLVLMCHQLSFHRKHSFFYRALSRLFERIMALNSDRIISAGEYLTSELYKLGCRKELISNAFATCQYPQILSLRKDSGTAIFVGSIVESKGVFELIESVHILQSKYKKKISVYVIGGSADKETLSSAKSLVGQYNLGSRIIFLGRCDPKELSIYYQISSIFLFPSHSETMGMALIEAMSAGCIPVVFNNSSMSYIVEDGRSGWVAENLDSDDLAAKLKKCLECGDQDVLKMRVMASLSAHRYVRKWCEVAYDIETAINKVLN